MMYYEYSVCRTGDLFMWDQYGKRANDSYVKLSHDK